MAVVWDVHGARASGPWSDKAGLLLRLYATEICCGTHATALNCSTGPSVTLEFDSKGQLVGVDRPDLAEIVGWDVNAQQLTPVPQEGVFVKCGFPGRPCPDKPVSMDDCTLETPCDESDKVQGDCAWGQPGTGSGWVDPWGDYGTGSWPEAGGDGSGTGSCHPYEAPTGSDCGEFKNKSQVLEFDGNGKLKRYIECGVVKWNRDYPPNICVTIPTPAWEAYLAGGSWESFLAATNVPDSCHYIEDALNCIPSAGVLLTMAVLRDAEAHCEGNLTGAALVTYVLEFDSKGLLVRVVEVECPYLYRGQTDHGTPLPECQCGWITTKCCGVSNLDTCEAVCMPTRLCCELALTVTAVQECDEYGEFPDPIQVCPEALNILLIYDPGTRKWTGQGTFTSYPCNITVEFFCPLDFSDPEYDTPLNPPELCECTTGSPATWGVRIISDCSPTAPDPQTITPSQFGECCDALLFVGTGAMAFVCKSATWNAAPFPGFCNIGGGGSALTVYIYDPNRSDPLDCDCGGISGGVGSGSGSGS